MRKAILFLPLVIVITIGIFLSIFLLQGKDPNKPPSALLNKSLPNFKISNIYDGSQSISNQNLEKKFILINFFASWCAPCKAEHPLFFNLKKQYPNLFLLGVNYKDKRNNAIKFLNQDGDPYDYVGVDNEGSLGLEFGVFGLPETFLVNSEGKIIYKHLGPLTKKIISDEIVPIIK